MIQITDPQYYYELCQEYKQVIFNKTKQKVWLEPSFYESFKKWVKDEYNIDNDGTIVLTFEDDRDYTMFMLKRK